MSTYEQELLATELFHSGDMPPKPIRHALAVTYYADVEDLLPLLDKVRASEFLDFHLEARSSDRWTAERVEVQRVGAAAPGA